MKKLTSIVLLVLALHAVAVAAGVGYLIGTGKLNKTSAEQIRVALFPQPTTQPSTTQPSAEEAVKGDSPLIRLEALLSRQANRSATEQVEFVRQQFDEQLSQLDRRYRDLKALESQVEGGRLELERERMAVMKREATMTARESDALKQEQDKGFASEIALYTSMKPAAVKGLFMGMDDAEAAKYVQALPPRTANKILDQFKTPEEKSRMNAIFAVIRKSEGANMAAAPEAGGAKGGTAGEPAPKSEATGNAEREPVANQGAKAAQ